MEIGGKIDEFEGLPYTLIPQLFRRERFWWFGNDIFNVFIVEVFIP